MRDRSNSTSIKVSNWGTALDRALFRRKLIVGVLVLALILMLFPHFFAYIESREGAVLHDWLLQQLKPIDFSIPLFVVIWSMTLLMIVRCTSQPEMFLEVIYCLILVCLARMLSIYLVQLNPPDTLVVIKDPLTSLTYGGKDVFITKDLFFSGHTSNMLMVALCFRKRTDRMIGFAAAIAVGVMVLFQHAHYTIDVLAAFVFTFFLVKLGKYLAAA